MRPPACLAVDQAAPHIAHMTGARAIVHSQLEPIGCKHGDAQLIQINWVNRNLRQHGAFSWN